MADITEIRLKIKAVEFALASFTRYRKKEEEREAFLETVQFLDVYSGFPKDKLQDALNKLQENENLLRTQQQGRINCFVSALLSKKVIIFCSRNLLFTVSNYRCDRCRCSRR